MSRLPAHRQAGFSLLEVLVSLVVVALTVGAAIRVYGQAADSALSGEQALSALMTAQSLLAEHGTTIPLKSGTSYGQAEPGLHWRSIISPYKGLDRLQTRRLPVRPFTVSVTVSWGDTKARSLTLQALKIGGSANDH